MELDYVPFNKRETITDEVDLIIYTFKNRINEIGEVSISEFFQD